MCLIVCVIVGMWVCVYMYVTIYLYTADVTPTTHVSPFNPHNIYIYIYIYIYCIHTTTLTIHTLTTYTHIYYTYHTLTHIVSPSDISQPNSLCLSDIDFSKLPSSVQVAVLDLEASTAHCKSFNFNICLSYGSRAEIVGACNEIIKDIMYGNGDNIGDRDRGDGGVSNGSNSSSSSSSGSSGSSSGIMM